MACTGCEAGVPTLQGIPMDETGADEHTYEFGKTLQDPNGSGGFAFQPRAEWELIQDPPGGEDDPTVTITVTLEKVTITGEDGSCTPSGANCVQDEPCSFTVVLSFSVRHYVGFPSGNNGAAAAEALLTPVSIGNSLYPGATNGQGTPEQTSYWPATEDIGDSYTYETFDTLTISVDGTCGQDSPETVTVAPDDNITVTAVGFVEDSEHDTEHRQFEVEFNMQCYACGGTVSGKKTQSTGQNLNVNSIENT